MVGRRRSSGWQASAAVGRDVHAAGGDGPVCCHWGGDRNLILPGRIREVPHGEK